MHALGSKLCPVLSRQVRTVLRSNINVLSRQVRTVVRSNVNVLLLLQECLLLWQEQLTGRQLEDPAVQVKQLTGMSSVVAGTADREAAGGPSCSGNTAYRKTAV